MSILYICTCIWLWIVRAQISGELSDSYRHALIYVLKAGVGGPIM